MRHRWLVPLILALAAGPAAAQPASRVWAIAIPKKGEPPDAVLRYAFLDSDDLALGFMCTKKTGQVKVIAASPVRLMEPQDPDAPRASRVVASVARKVRVPAGKVRVRLVIKAKAKRGNRCLLRTTRKVLQRKTCGLKQTVFNITAKRGTVVYVQISGKNQKTVNTRKIRL